MFFGGDFWFARKLEKRIAYPKTPRCIERHGGGLPKLWRRCWKRGRTRTREARWVTPPLHSAATGTGEVVAALLEAGADLEARNLNGSTPLHLAARDGVAEVVITLLEAGGGPRGAETRMASNLSNTPETTRNSRGPVFTGCCAKLGSNSVSRSKAEMERRPTSILTTLAVSVMALTLIAPWALGQDPDPITEIGAQAFAALLTTDEYQTAVIEGDALCPIQPRSHVRHRGGQAGKTTLKLCTGIDSPLSRATPTRSSTSDSNMPEAKACRRTMLKRRAGIVSPPSRGIRTRSTASGLCTPTATACRKNDAEAVKRYRLAAEQGDDRAQIAMGIIYAGGEGVLQDDAEAARWYRLAAEQGGARVQFQPWDSSTSTVAASSRTPSSRTCGSTSLAQTGAKPPESHGTILNVT